MGGIDCTIVRKRLVWHLPMRRIGARRATCAVVTERHYSVHAPAEDALKWG
jgi:hypothetical protein